MIALIQRVSQARVRIDTRVAGEIGAGILAFVCAERGDTELDADTLIEKLLTFRVFADASGRMNLSLRDVNGGLLLVSQFTLAADTDSGTRPGFSRAAPPDEGRLLFDCFVSRARVLHPLVASGEFGAMMQVELINDGPVTFWLQSKRRKK